MYSGCCGLKYSIIENIITLRRKIESMYTMSPLTACTSFQTAPVYDQQGRGASRQGSYCASFSSANKLLDCEGHLRIYAIENYDESGTSECGKELRCMRDRQL